VDTNRTIRWETIAVTPLPAGWRNVFFSDDAGTPDAHPCPAVLLQENRGMVVAREGGRPVFEAAEPPYETRVVFADWDHGCLCPVVESTGFAGIIGPGQSPEDCDGM
jgi:hypothetical protein